MGHLRETTLTENIGPPGLPGVGLGADNPILQNLFFRNHVKDVGQI
jgi:hypothetical protein